MAAAKKKAHPGMKRDKKTGKLVKVDSKKSSAAKKAAKKRTRTLSAQHRAKIGAARKKAIAAGYTFVWKNGKKVKGRKILKQGRPKGSKNAPGSKKPGPKPGSKRTGVKKPGPKKSHKKTTVKKVVKAVKKVRAVKKAAPKVAKKMGKVAKEARAVKMMKKVVPEMKVNRAKGMKAR